VDALPDCVSLGLRNHGRLIPISGTALRRRSVDLGLRDQVSAVSFSSRLYLLQLIPET
jgi:hypothetical protein